MVGPKPTPFSGKFAASKAEEDYEIIGTEVGARLKAAFEDCPSTTMAPVDLYDKILRRIDRYEQRLRRRARARRKKRRGW